jgi:AraC family transcriptional regulator
VATKVRPPYFGRVLRTRKLSHFTVTETVCSPEFEISKHTHERPYISLPLRGSYTEVCGSTNWHCKPGDSIFHVADECHFDRFHEGGGHLLNLDMSPQLVFRLVDSGIRTDDRILFSSTHCRQLTRRLQSELRNTDPVSDLALEAIAMEILVEVLRSSVKQQKQRSPAWLNRVREVVCDRYRENLTLGELASEAGVHPVHLARAFRTRYSCSIGDYIRRLRIEAACNSLARSATPISAIAMETGFSDQSHLTRTFKQYMGVAPLEYRKSCAIV